jgi:hypothetical protein
MPPVQQPVAEQHRLRDSALGDGDQVDGHERSDLDRGGRTVGPLRSSSCLLELTFLGDGDLGEVPHHLVAARHAVVLDQAIIGAVVAADGRGGWVPAADARQVGKEATLLQAGDQLVGLVASRRSHATRPSASHADQNGSPGRGGGAGHGGQGGDSRQPQRAPTCLRARLPVVLLGGGTCCGGAGGVTGPVRLRGSPIAPPLSPASTKRAILASSAWSSTRSGSP